MPYEAELCYRCQAYLTWLQDEQLAGQSAKQLLSVLIRHADSSAKTTRNRRTELKQRGESFLWMFVVKIRQNKTKAAER